MTDRHFPARATRCMTVPPHAAQGRMSRSRPVPTTRGSDAARRLRRQLRRDLQRRSSVVFLAYLLANQFKPEAPVDPNDNYHPQPARSPGEALSEFGTERGPATHTYRVTDNAGTVVPHPASIGLPGTAEEQKRVLADVLAGLNDLPAGNAS